MDYKSKYYKYKNKYLKLKNLQYGRSYKKDLYEINDDKLIDINDEKLKNYELWTAIITNDDKNIVKLLKKIQKEDIQNPKIYIGHSCNDDEWKLWKIKDPFIWENRQFAIIERDTKEKYMVYKSQSGMLWHLLQRDGGYAPFKKFNECGLYSTSLLLDLNLQKKLCELSISETVDKDTFEKKLRKTKWMDTFNMYGWDEDGNLANKNSYNNKLLSNTTKCDLNNPYIIFQKLIKELSNEGVPGCNFDRDIFAELYNKGVVDEDGKIKVDEDGKIKNDSQTIYEYLKKKINEKMEKLFEDIGNEKKLYDCMSGKIALIYFIRVFVKVKYSIFVRDIKSKENNTKFKLFYSKYSFVEDKENNINIPDKEFIGREFITPLFITSCNNIQKNIPIYNKVASTGLYTCKAFEYGTQAYGDYNYEIGYSKVTDNENIIDKKNSEGNEKLFDYHHRYFFLGDFMDKLWPFNK